MADPIVHISGGLPDSGTGNITTLGMTVASIGGSTTGQLGPMVQGVATTSAPSYTTAQINPLSLNLAGGLRVDGSAVTQPVSGSVTLTGSPAISGTVTANQGGAPWTMKPDGTVWALTGTSANINVTNASIPVTGTFWQATQPISAAALPLPSGAATAANQTNVQGVIGNATAPANMSVVGGVFNTIKPTLANGQSAAIQVNNAGIQLVDLGSTFSNVNALLVNGTVSANQSGTWTVQQGTPPWTVNGDTAAGVTDANNPVKIGGLAKTTNPTAVTDGQRVNAMFTKHGKLVTAGSPRELKGKQKTSISVSTETTVVTAGAAGVFNDVYSILVTNKSATAVFIDFRDSTAGTVQMTIAAPAGDTRGFAVAIDSAMTQTTAANNWTATVSSAVSSIEITMLYVSNT